MTTLTFLQDLVSAQKRGTPVGIFSVCSANPFVLEAAMQRAKLDQRPLLIESTSNQVNQFGGYTQQTPAQFRHFVLDLARNLDLDPELILLGGDHLGPNPWQNEGSETALPKASQLVADYVRAGYTKIHLDASMHLADDGPGPLPPETVAERSAALCEAAEAAWRELPPGSPPPNYVIGTEVPPPGGAQSEAEALEVTPVGRARETIEIAQQALQQRGLEAAWERVIALVVQPGVEFGDASIHPYQREEAKALSEFIETVPGLVYEAHSTDYQTPQKLRQMVEDHFAILKVGPALTFALREAVFALELIEGELLGQDPDSASRLQQVVEEEMLAIPEDWVKYYRGSGGEQRLARRFSLSDRIRYYWNYPRVQEALNHLLENLQGRVIPLTLISQYFPIQYLRIRQDRLEPTPLALIHDKIVDVIRDYRYACYPELDLPVRV